MDRLHALFPLAGSAVAATNACTISASGRTNAMTAHPDGFPHVVGFRRTSIYEVNIRPFTAEGTITEFESHSALTNGQYGSALEWLPIDNATILALRRQRGDSRVTVTVNVSNAPLPPTGRTLPAWGGNIETA